MYRIMHERTEIRNFSSNVQLDISRVRAAHTRIEIVYPQAATYYFVKFITTLLTRRRRLYSRVKKGTRCLSLMTLNRASDVSVADWRSIYTREKGSLFFMCGDTLFYSG